MGRQALSPEAIDDFRTRVVEVATRRFAEHGYEGVTMRALAADLGCSPMTPYRYFQNKAEIFEAVRNAAFARFAEGQEAASASSKQPAERLRALCRAYVRFALDEPAAYRIMFELDQPSDTPVALGESLRAWNAMHAVVEDAVEAGVLHGDADLCAHLLWSGIHGLVALHLSGVLALGRDLESLVDAFIERELSRPAGLSASPNEAPIARRLN